VTNYTASATTIYQIPRPSDRKTVVLKLRYTILQKFIFAFQEEHEWKKQEESIHLETQIISNEPSCLDVNSISVSSSFNSIYFYTSRIIDKSVSGLYRPMP